MTTPVGTPPLGFLRARVSNARLWATGARRLLLSDEYPDVELGYVAAYLAVNFASQLIFGADGFRGDVVARADFPVDAKVMRHWRHRLEKVRDAILHFGDMPHSEARQITASWKSGSLTLTAPVGRPRVVRVDSIPRQEVLHLLDRLEPWLQRHDERLQQERDWGGEQSEGGSNLTLV
jgi:hypothetical protein